jgi:FMN phosphatase YigB (HAD superfamily)
MILFDFDGVLIDSLNEVALTAYNAATENLFTSLSEIPGAAVALFKRNRFHVQQIGDAITLMNWCIERPQFDSTRPLSKEEYRTVTSGDTATLNARTNLIYETRKRFIDRDENRWLSLHQPYQPLWNELIKRDDRMFVILTNKNHDATLRLCRHFGLDIDTNDIYSGDRGTTKVENMQQIQNRFGIEYVSFIDDSLKNLKDLDLELNQEKKILSLILAGWGYTGPDDVRIAQESGYRVFNQTDLVLLMGSTA